MSASNIAGQAGSKSARSAHAAEIASKTNDQLGKAAQTAGTPTSQPANVWTQTFENTGRTPATGLQPVMAAGSALSKIAPGLGVGMAAGAAAISVGVAVRAAVEAGFQSSSASDVGTAMGQQASAIGDQVLQLLHLSDDPTKPAPQGVLGHVAASFALLTSIEQLLCMPLAMPALPAVRILDTDIGMPHAHMHPPNLVPPNPVPIPLPSTGPVIPIPYVSGASTVLINGMPAGRCGDMGLGIFCGGFFPMFEIFLGSSSVWLEGNRAARVGTDITKHCMFSNPKSIAKSTDVPIGPMIGTTVAGSMNVVIGGFPLPSLSGMAIGAAFKALFNGFGKMIKALRSKGGKASQLVRESSEDAVTQVSREAATNKLGGKGPDVLKNYVKASQLIQDMLDGNFLKIAGDDAFKKAVESDLRKIACTKTGRDALEQIVGSNKKVTIEPWPAGKSGNAAAKKSTGAYTPGVGSDSTVYYNPTQTGRPPGSPPDVGLMHEMGHARNNAMGTAQPKNVPAPEPGYPQKYGMEEYNNLKDADNPYRQEMGYPPRADYNTPMP